MERWRSGEVGMNKIRKEGQKAKGKGKKADSTRIF